MSAVSSFIVRVYRRRCHAGISGTVEAVPDPATKQGACPQPFVNEAELLGLLGASGDMAQVRKPAAMSLRPGGK